MALKDTENEGDPPSPRLWWTGDEDEEDKWGGVNGQLTGGVLRLDFRPFGCGRHTHPRR